jgi:hypothetical protein
MASGGGTRPCDARWNALEGDFAMTRLFLAAGVAALAITMPASAKPPGDRGGHGGQAAAAQSGGGGEAKARGGSARRTQAQRLERGGGGQRMQAQRFEQRSSPRMQVQRFERRGGDRAAARVERRQAAPIRMRGAERRTERQAIRTQRIDRPQVRMADRQQIRNERFDRRQLGLADRQQLRANRIEQVRGNEAFRNELRANRIERLDNGMLVRDVRHGGRALRAEDFRVNAQGYGIGGCPPGLASKGCMPPGQAAKLLGTRLSDATRIASLSGVPISARYLYPDTDDYFYRYGDSYLYRVDRDTSLISALLPLAFGGYMPGSYLPNSYMSSPYYGMGSYFPSAYGFNSFYPDYGNDCYRYGNGVVYEVDCFTGLVEDVIPLYAGGYGVGQLLPSGYGYYNVPLQYRDMYYDTSDYGYWYSPGAIYQYDPSSSLITSVAALLSPGFTVGQPMPLGYDVYNVPYAYRSTYYDTPTAYYRYNNGYIYQVDPTTQLVTAIVASILT